MATNQIHDDAGNIGGMFSACTEETPSVVDRRRVRTLRALADRSADAESVDDACDIAARTLGDNPHDLPFVLLYLLDADGRRAHLAGRCGLDAAASPRTIDLDAADDHPWPLRAVVLPMLRPAQTQLAGFMVAGTSPRQPLDDGYRDFLALVAGQVATAVANARAYESAYESVVEDSRAPSPESRVPSIDRPHILVAGDDAELRESVTRRLATRYDVAAVGDGHAAIDAARADAVRASEARQAFLLRLGDALRPLADPIEVQATETRLQRMVNIEGVGVLTFDVATGTVLDANDAFLQMTGYDRAQIDARALTWQMMTPLEHAAVSDAQVDLLSRTGHIGPYEKEYFRADVNDRERAEAALHETQRRLEEALATARMAYWDWDPATDSTVASRSMDDLFGLRDGESYANSARGIDLVHVDDRERHRALVEGSGARNEGWHAEFRVVRPRDGQVVWLEERATVTRDPVSGARHATGLVWDITDRKRAEAAAEHARLTAGRDELRRALAAAEEGERRRLARELHDRLGQHLTGFALGLADVRHRVATGAPADARLDQLEELARLMTRDARALALELRPPELDDVGLESAIETYVREWGMRHGVAADVALLGPVGHAMPAEARSALYRIVQEALTNVAKHAGATQVSVILEKPDGEVRLLVEDDGRGFDVDSATARARAERRLGLAGMRERAALVGGTLAIDSSPGAGTTLQVRLPLRHPVERDADR